MRHPILAVLLLLISHIRPSAGAGSPEEALLAALREPAHGDLASVRRALEEGADADTRSGAGTALSLAVQGSWPEAVQLLLAHGADPDEASLLSLAAAQGDRGSIDALIAAGVSVEARDAEGRTAIGRAAISGHLSIIEYLLEIGADVSTVNLERAGGGPVVERLTPLVNDFEHARKLPAGSDLGKVAAEIAGGEVFDLAPGEYPGTFLLKGKCAVLRGDPGGATVLTGGGEPAALIAIEGAHLTLRDVVIAPAGSSKMGLYVKGSTAVLSRATIRRPVEAGCYVQDGRLHADHLVVEEPGTSAVAAFEKSQVRLIDSQVRQPGQVGIYQQDGGTLTIARVVFHQAQQAIRAADGSIRVHLDRIEATGPGGDQHAAFSLTGVGAASLHRNTSQGYFMGADVSGVVTSPVAITRNMILGGSVGLRISVRGDPASGSVRLARCVLLGQSQAALMLEDTAGVSTTRNLILAGEAVGVLVRAGSTVESRQDLIAGSQATFLFDGVDPAAASLRGTVLRGPAEPALPGSALDPLTVRFSSLTAGVAGDELEQRCQEVIEVTKETPPIPAGVLESALDGVIEVTRRMSAETARMAEVGLVMRDDAGRVEVPEFQVHGGEDAPAPPPGREPLARGSWSSPTVPLPAGTYWLVPAEFPEAAIRVAVAPGQRTVREARLMDTLWMEPPVSDPRTAAGGRGAPLLLRLKSRERRVRSLSRLRMNGERQNWVVPRPGVPEAERQEAREIARKVFVATQDPQPPAGLSTEALHAWNTRDWISQQAAVRVLVALGDRDDAGSLSTWSESNGPYAARGRLEMLGRLEARLGTLDGGELERRLVHPDPLMAIAAAMALHRLGSSRGDALLIASMRQAANREDIGEAAYALLDTADPEVRASMRALLGFCVRDGKVEVDYSAAAACLYLLANGDPEDWRMIGSLPMTKELAGWIPHILEDIRPIVRLSAITDEFMVPYASPLRDAGEERAEELREELRQILWAKGDEEHARDESRSDGETSVNTFELLASYQFPSAVAADFYARGEALSAPWMPVEWEQERLLSSLSDGTLDNLTIWRLDYIPHEKVVAALAAPVGENPFHHPDIFRVHHRTCYRGFYAPEETYQDGIERRPYFLRHDHYEGGVISGVMEMRPRLVDGQLEVALRPRQKYKVVRGTFISRQPAREFEIYGWITAGGRALLGSVSLRRGDEVTPLSYAGLAGDGSFLYRGAMANQDLAGACLDLELSFRDERPLMVFDLYASEYARVRRKLTERAEVWEAITGLRPGDAASWIERARCEASLGRVTAGRSSYERAMALLPEDGRLMSEVVQFFEKHEMLDPAVALLQSRLQSAPGSAELLADLAALHFRRGLYLDTVLACTRAKVVEARPDLDYLEAACRYLVGDPVGAAAVLGTRPEEVGEDVSLALWYIARRARGGGSEDDRQQVDGYRDFAKDRMAADMLGLLTSKTDPALVVGLTDPRLTCRGRCYAGYQALWSGRPAVAKTFFESALELGAQRQIEHHLARYELDNLGEVE